MSGNEAKDPMLDELLSLDPAEWQIRQAIALLWYDGPTAGFCRLARPAVEFYFTLLDERFNPDDLNDRLFAIHEISPGAYEELVKVLTRLGSPEGEIWCPIFLGHDEEVLRSISAQVDVLIAATVPTEGVIYAKQYLQFGGCWRIPEDERPADDWFAHLGI